MVVVKNQAAFRFRYPAYAGTIAGEYSGSLNNAGERIELDAPVGGIIHDFQYKDSWYGQTDGEGFSLTIRDPAGAADLWALEERLARGAAPGGTPGYDDTLTAPGSIVISEVLAHSDAPLVDAIELHNVGGTAVDISGWFLSDEKTDALGNNVRDEVPDSRHAADRGRRLCRSSTQTSMFGGAFSLSEFGDDVYLSSNAGGVAGGYREHVDFGASPRNVSDRTVCQEHRRHRFHAVEHAHLRAPDTNSPPYLEDVVINEIDVSPGHPHRPPRRPPDSRTPTISSSSSSTTARRPRRIR